MNLYALPIGERAPEIINIVVEIPKGTCNKVEYDPEIEIFRLDRVHHSSVHYPGDYGFISGTLIISALMVTLASIASAR